MATEPDERDVFSTDDYERETETTRWIDLVDGPGSVEVVEEKPLAVLKTAREAGVLELLSGDDDVDQAAMMADGSFERFLDDFVVPRVKTPSFYYSNEEDGDEDFAALTESDMRRVILGIMGRDAGDLDGDVDAADQFRG